MEEERQQNEKKQKKEEKIRRNVEKQLEETRDEAKKDGSKSSVLVMGDFNIIPSSYGKWSLAGEAISLNEKGKKMHAKLDKALGQLIEVTHDRPTHLNKTAQILTRIDRFFVSVPAPLREDGRHPGRRVAPLRLLRRPPR